MALPGQRRVQRCVRRLCRGVGQRLLLLAGCCCCALLLPLALYLLLWALGLARRDGGGAAALPRAALFDTANRYDGSRGPCSMTAPRPPV
jgi:hypothetical protein